MANSPQRIKDLPLATAIPEGAYIAIDSALDSDDPNTEVRKYPVADIIDPLEEDIATAQQTAEASADTVKQTSNSTVYNANYRVLLGNSANDTEETATVQKSELRYNPLRRSFAESANTTASGNNSHAEGDDTIASGFCAHAEGYYTTASGDESHAEGRRTVANHRSQHVFGDYNLADTSTTSASSRGNYVEIVGNGTADNSRSNARTLDWEGNEVLAGKLTVGADPTNDMEVATKQYVDNNTGTGDVADVYENGVSVVDETDKIARIKTHKEVTQAEYDALPDSKYTDGIAYCIKDSTFTASDVPYNNTNSGLSSDNTQGAIDELASNLLIKKSIENTDIATFSDGANLPMPSLKVSIEPIQEGSGDPSPSNVRPISGWTEVNVTRCGKNLCHVASGEIKSSNLVTFTNPLPSGTYSISFMATRTGESTDNASMIIYDKDDVAYNGRYVVPNTGERNKFENVYYNNGISRIYFYSITGSWGQSQNYTLSISDFQIELGSTATAYEPYNGHTYTIQFKDGDNPLTVYGGSLDVDSGELVVDRVGVIYDGSENNWVWTDMYKQASINLPQNAKYSVAGISWKCNNLTPVANTSRPANIGNFSSLVSSGGASAFSAPNCNTLEEFKTWVSNNNIQFCYELATPTTFNTQPTSIKSLEGVNNVWADCGNIKDLKYVRNLNITINDLISRVEALEG